MTANEHWLSILGIGEDGWDGLNHEARQAVASAELLYGGGRHLALVPTAASSATRIAWPSPMASALLQILTAWRGAKRVAVLASGDPMLHGVGVTLTRDLAPEEFRVIPQVSAFSLACARLGWPMGDTDLVSLVNRPIQQLHCRLYPGQRLIVFSKDGGTPSLVTAFLTQAGYGPSAITVLENLGGPAERKTCGRASDWPAGRRGHLNLIAIVCVPDTNCAPLSLVPGLPDDAFESDGQLTKREVRAVTIARLAPLPHQCLWDVGAGTGTIAIEWMRVHPSCSAIAFEVREDRAARIRFNAARLGVPRLEIMQGAAPASFTGLPRPDAIFIGGSVANDDLFDACWEKLSAGGRIVTNAVTIDSEAALVSHHARYGGDLTRLSVSRAEPVGNSYAWRPMMPITQWAVTKP
jgi:precorrin-6Y C5,15-methyltransferase (decarboxylating)